LAIAQREIGTKEVPGPEHNLRILAYHQATTFQATTDEVPWCSSFVCWCLERAGIDSTRSARARSYEEWGQKLDPSRIGPGAIVVFWRGTTQDEGKGHVGFYVGGDPASGRIAVLGGNQGNGVKVGTYPTTHLIGFYWPQDLPLPSQADVDRALALQAGEAEVVWWA